MPWYKQWFGEEYLELYAHRDEGEAERDADFVESLFGGRRPRAILDLACGAGRHTAALRRRGHRVLGVDLSLVLLAQPPPLPRVAGDMRCLPFAEHAFDWVLNFFTSFGYFENERENFQVLAEIARVLPLGGRCLLDLMNLDATLAGLKEYEQREDGGRCVEIRRWWDPQQRRVNKRIRIAGRDETKAGGDARTFLESVRAYTLDEVTMGLRWAGLEVEATFGSFAGEAYGRDSERLILVGHRVH
ncbi:MAG TPA: class I SAM-dependent methyltransferase [Thermoanaerobaculia bacterium]|nr:class I SAM-dependent methyltransferase [Thermoanaerobaculia bacterium]